MILSAFSSLRTWICTTETLGVKFNFVDSEDASRSFSGHGDYHGHKCLSWVEILHSQLNDGYLIQIFFVFNIFKLLPAVKVPSSSANFFVKDQLVYILRFVCLLWDCVVRISHYERRCNWINMTVVQSNYLFVGTYLDFSNPFAMLEIQKFSYTFTYLLGGHRKSRLSVMTTVVHYLSLFSWYDNVIKVNS